jgi:lipid-A-disaccharide synthase
MKVELPAPALGGVAGGIAGVGAPGSSGLRPDLLIIAGEHSGDAHAAAMVRGLLAAHPERRDCAIGGPQLAASGAQLLWDLTASSVVGLVEVLRNLPFFSALSSATLEWIREYRPRAVCLVDYPGFNLRLAERLRRLGLSRQGGGEILLLYYISPQIWAWKGARRFTMARDLDAMAVIFPFEVKSYADTALPVEFVGHPLVDAEGHENPVSYDPEGPVLLLPGSRRQAVRRIFPALLAGHQAADLRPAVVLYPSGPIRAVLESVLASGNFPNVSLRAVSESKVGASAVLTSSGTMSMQCALAGIPGAIAYRANTGTYWMGRMLLQVKYLGIANLLLEEPMYPEYLQGAATPAALSREIADCLAGPQRREKARVQAQRLRDILSAPAASTPAAWLARQLQNGIG